MIKKIATVLTIAMGLNTATVTQPLPLIPKENNTTVTTVAETTKSTEDATDNTSTVTNKANDEEETDSGSVSVMAGDNKLITTIEEKHNSWFDANNKTQLADNLAPLISGIEKHKDKVKGIYEYTMGIADHIPGQISVNDYRAVFDALHRLDYKYK